MEFFYLKDAPPLGCAAEFREEWLNQRLHKNICQSQELAQKMECFHTTIEKHLHLIWKVQNCGACVLHALIDNNKI